MKAPIIAAIIVTIGVMLQASVSAKGRTTRIVIVDSVTGQAMTITDEDVLAQLNVWDGPGTFINGVPGTRGFIIDWRAGTVPRPAGARRYEVRFYADVSRSAPEQLVYVVDYERDAQSRQGFVYLPGRADERYRRNVDSIYRGLEGNWFHSNSAWERAIQPLIPAQ
jgi:hypothetical protein